MASQNRFLVQQSSFSMAAIPSSHLHKGRPHPLFLCCRRDLHDRRNVVSLSASAAARDPPFPAVIVSSPSSKIRTTATRFGLRTTVTQFCARQGPIAGAADADAALNSGDPVQSSEPVPPRRVAIFPWRTIVSTFMNMLAADPEIEALVFLPLFRRCGVQLSLLKAALNWKNLFMFLVAQGFLFLDTHDMCRCQEEWMEYDEKQWTRMRERVYLRFEVWIRELTVRELIRSGICKPDAGQDANPEFQG